MIASLVLALHLSAPTPSAPPWTLVDALPRSEAESLVAPRIVVLDDHTLVGTYEQFAKRARHVATHVVRSADGGATWERVASLDAPRSASLFAHEGVLHLLGTDGPEIHGTGRVVVRRSLDGGRTWTPLDAPATGYLRGDDLLEGWGGASLVSRGRVWRAFPGQRDAVSGPTVLLASAPIAADLLDPASWRWSGEVVLAAVNGRTRSPLALIAHDDGPPTFLVLDSQGRTRAQLDVAEDGWRMRNAGTLAQCAPAGLSGAGLVRDELSGAYWALTTGPCADEPPDSLDRAWILHRSDDCETWTSRSVLEDRRRVGATFPQIAWAIAGDDLVGLATSWAMPRRGDPPGNQRLVFARIPGFRSEPAQIVADAR